MPARKVQAHTLTHLIRGLNFPTSEKDVRLEGGDRFCVLFPLKKKLICTGVIEMRN